MLLTQKGQTKPQYSPSFRNALTIATIELGCDVLSHEKRIMQIVPQSCATKTTILR